MQTKHSIDVEVDWLSEVLQGSGEYGIAKGSAIVVHVTLA